MPGNTAAYSEDAYPATDQSLDQPMGPISDATRHITGRSRALNSLAGVIPAAIAMPLVLGVWTPTWFTIAWVATYLLGSATLILITLLRPVLHIEQAWSIFAAVLFGLVPISAVIWSTRPQDFWAAMTVSIVFIAFETAALPFLRMYEWRIGVVLVGACVVGSALVVLHPLVALAFIPVLFAIINAADRSRLLKVKLEEHLLAAQMTVLHDPLTGLLNRRGLRRSAEQLDGHDVTLALIDVDRFNMINDTHGHQVGDLVLAAVAEQLRGRLSDTFELARLGGDEFVAIAAGDVRLDPSHVEPVITETSLHGQSRTIECALSVGIARGTNLDAAQSLLSEAGFAMRDAKRSGSGLESFGAALSQRRQRTLQVAAIGSGDSDHGGFVPVAQAIVDHDRIVGCELLVRWKRPDGQILSPAQFLPMANETGLMATINNLMLEHAVTFAARFNNRPMAPFVSVNISAPHLSETSFADRVEELLKQHRVPPERLMIEVTETDQLGGYGNWESVASHLRSIGVRLAMDDFGTGYSSLERLQHLPISHLKIDRSLLKAVSGPFGEIVGGVARFANALNIGLIAEGIETLDEYESMRAFGVQMFQGFHFHRPQPLSEVEILIIEDHMRVNDALVADG